MKDEKQKFGTKSFYEQGMLDPNEEFTPFHEGMKPSVDVIAIDGNNQSESVLSGYEEEMLMGNIRHIQSNRPKLTNEQIKKAPSNYGVFRNGKFVSLQDEYNNSKGMKTDRKGNNSLKKRNKEEPAPKVGPGAIASGVR